MNFGTIICSVDFLCDRIGVDLSELSFESRKLVLRGSRKVRLSPCSASFVNKS